MLAIDQIPMWLLFFSIIILALLFIEAGFRLGRRTAAKGQEITVGPIVTAMLSLLAFIIAFTYGIALSRFDDRRLLIVEESNAIRTTYLRADFIEEPFRSNIKNVLRQYANVRMNDIFQKEMFDPILAQAEGLENQLWQQAIIVEEKHPLSKPAGLFVESLNQMINMHAKRVASRLCSRIPDSIWGCLFLVASISMIETGYRCGTAGKQSIFTNIMLAITFSVVITLLIDLDRPWEGFTQANQLPMTSLKDKLGLLIP